jgi:hypothetical protein
LQHAFTNVNFLLCFERLLLVWRNKLSEVFADIQVISERVSNACWITLTQVNHTLRAKNPVLILRQHQILVNEDYLPVRLPSEHEVAAVTDSTNLDLPRRDDTDEEVLRVETVRLQADLPAEVRNVGAALPGTSQAERLSIGVLFKLKLFICAVIVRETNFLVAVAEARSRTSRLVLVLLLKGEIYFFSSEILRWTLVHDVKTIHEFAGEIDITGLANLFSMHTQTIVHLPHAIHPSQLLNSSVEEKFELLVCLLRITLLFKLLDDAQINSKRLEERAKNISFRHKIFNKSSI